MDAVLEIRVHAKAKRNSVEAHGGSTLGVWVTAAPEGGKANEAVIALLAKRLGVSKSSLSILRGHKSRNKLLSFEGLVAEEVFARLGPT